MIKVNSLPFEESHYCFQIMNELKEAGYGYSIKERVRIALIRHLGEPWSTQVVGEKSVNRLGVGDV
jgi:hypothetical protein